MITIKESDIQLINIVGKNDVEPSEPGLKQVITLEKRVNPNGKLYYIVYYGYSSEPKGFDYCECCGTRYNYKNSNMDKFDKCPQCGGEIDPVAVANEIPALIYQSLEQGAEVQIALEDQDDPIILSL